MADVLRIALRHVPDAPGREVVGAECGPEYCSPGLAVTIPTEKTSASRSTLNNARTRALERPRGRLLSIVPPLQMSPGLLSAEGDF